MGTQIQVLPQHDAPAVHEDSGRHRRQARHVLLLMWATLVATPWILQVRSFSALVARHKITQNLIPSATATRVTTAVDVIRQCPVRGMWLSGAWWATHPTHCYLHGDCPTYGSVLCHFIMPQYNTHGAYVIQNHKIKPPKSSPASCANDSYTVNYYGYHGSIGYYAFYSEGEGSYCVHDAAIHSATAVTGSSDINFSALARYEGSPGYHSSYFFGCVGSTWILYRGIVLTRSFRSCARFGLRLDTLKEPISISSAMVFAQQAARLAPHTATNWHRFGLIYLLIEGVMTDLFLLTAFDGLLAKLQYISLGYNVAGLLSMLFEILDSSKSLRLPTLLLLKRVLFNTELALKGELLFSLAMSQYLTALARSPLGNTAQIAEAASHYVWSLFNHGVIVVGHTAFILAVRVVGTLVYVQCRYGSLRVLTTSCCVDEIMGYRCKLVKVSGYELHNQRMYFSRDALKAHGLFKMLDSKGTEYLVYHKIHWLPSSREDLAVVGKLTGEHVDSWPESLYDGPVTICDRILGGVVDENRIPNGSDGVDELESARMVHH